jgi:hypothetical protein
MNAASELRAIPDTRTNFNPLMSIALLCAVVSGRIALPGYFRPGSKPRFLLSRHPGAPAS